MFTSADSPLSEGLEGLQRSMALPKSPVSVISSSPRTSICNFTCAVSGARAPLKEPHQSCRRALPGAAHVGVGIGMQGHRDIG